MARVNIDDDIEKSDKFFRLVALLGGDQDRALGKLVRFFRLTQGPWVKGEGVSKDKIDDEGLSEMITTGWAVPFERGYTAKGAESHFKWIKQKTVAGRLGGRPPKKTERLAQQTERLAQRSGSNPLYSLTLNSKEESKAKELPPVVPEILSTPEFIAAWADWLLHRKQLKKPMTYQSQEGQLRKLANWGVKRSLAALRFSIANGYQGVFEPTGKEQPQEYIPQINMLVTKQREEPDDRS